MRWERGESGRLPRKWEPHLPRKPKSQTGVRNGVATPAASSVEFRYGVSRMKGSVVRARGGGGSDDAHGFVEGQAEDLSACLRQ